MIVTITPSTPEEGKALKMVETGLGFTDVQAGVVFTADGKFHLFPKGLDAMPVLVNLELVRDAIKDRVRLAAAEQEHQRIQIARPGVIPFPGNGRAKV